MYDAHCGSMATTAAMYGGRHDDPGSCRMAGRSMVSPAMQLHPCANVPEWIYPNVRAVVDRFKLDRTRLHITVYSASNLRAHRVLHRSRPLWIHCIDWIYLQ